MGGITFTNGLGGLGAGMFCIECDTQLMCEEETGNYRCPKAGCGKGGISSPDGIKTTVDERGNVKLSSMGKAPSED
jgi:hypothetical protein